MASRICIVLLGLLAAATSSAISKEDINIWFDAGDGIIVLSRRVEQRNALEACKNLGHTLVSLKDASLNRAVAGRLLDYQFEHGWTSGVHNQDEDAYFWTNALGEPEPVEEFTSWDRGQPVAEGQRNCITVTGNGKWRVKDCNALSYAICQKA